MTKFVVISKTRLAAACYLLALTLVQLEAVPASQKLQYQQQHQQQQQLPFGNIFGSASVSSNLNSIVSNNIEKKEKPARHPQLQPGPVGEEQVLDRFNIRYPDGSYEFRYELSDGTARYERGYFLYYDKLKTLVVVGYYSYRLPDSRYITVFYNADQHGYRQNQSITPQSYPNLPRSIEVPQFKEDPTATATTAPVSATRPSRF